MPAFRRASQTWQDVGLNLAHPQAFYDTAASLVQLSDDGSLLNTFRNWEGRKCYVHGDENADHPTVQAVKGIETISIPQSGHFSMSDNPDVFYSELHSFIRG
jgi:pimeloyl-ACP methyl ester carboxylesterase